MYGSSVSGIWQKKFAWKDRFVSVLVVSIIALASSIEEAPNPREPNPPEFETSAASLGVETPAIGDRKIGTSILSCLSKSISTPQ